MRTEAEKRAQRTYYERNKARVRTKNAAYQKAHPEKRALWSKRWRAKNKAKWSAYCKTPRVRLTTYRLAAARRGIAWALPEALALDLLTDLCFYCHAFPAPTNGIDRVDSGRGYEYGNVVTACAECNRAKGTRTREQFEQHAIRVARIANA